MNLSFVFGKETKGLSNEILDGNLQKGIRIPMKSNIARSLNLANSVNIILYEALRQLDFSQYRIIIFYFDDNN